jgi:hypothetical protein
VNELDTGKVYLTLGNPNPSSSKTKLGACYRVSFELPQDEWQLFMDSETKGMVLEAQCIVTHSNTPDKPKGGPISKNAGMLCQEPEANAFAVAQGYEDMQRMIYTKCAISSRAELDHNESAAQVYESLKHRFYRWEGERSDA